MVINYFKIGWRNLLQNRLTSWINFLGLSIAVTCCIIIFVFIKYESGFDSFYSNYRKIHRVVQHTEFPEETAYWNTTPYPLAEALRNDHSEIEIITQTSGPVKSNFSIESETGKREIYEESAVLFVDTFFPKIFDLTWIEGYPETALEDPNSIILTEKLAQKWFGNELKQNESLLGKRIIINGKDPLQVTGLVQNPPANTNIGYNILIPYEFFRQSNKSMAGNWSANHQGSTFLILDEQKDRKVTAAEISSLRNKYVTGPDQIKVSYDLQPLAEVHNETRYGNNIGGYTMPKKILFGSSTVGLFILIIALVNFVNIITAHSITRSKEVGIRKVLGSTRSNLIKQFLLENFILIIIILSFSLWLSHLLLTGVNDFFSVLNLDLSLTWEDALLVFASGTAIILLSSLYPALVLSSYKPITALKNKIFSGKSKGLNLRKSLTVFQFVIVQALIIGTLIVAGQMDFIQNKDKGFNSAGILSIPIPDGDKHEVFRNQLLKEKNISAVAVGSGPPMAVDGLSLGTSFRLPHQPEEKAKETEIKIGDINYLNLFNLNLLAGKNFKSDTQNFDFIVNEKLIHSLGWTAEEAIGKQLQINEGVGTILGVVEDYHNNSLQTEITPAIITNWNFFLKNAFIDFHALENSTLASIESIFKDTFPSTVFNYNFIEESIEKEYLLETSIFHGFKVFSFIAIVIASLGLFGFMAAITQQKTKEVGIRKVLGSSVSQIIIFFSKEFTHLILLSFFIAIPIIYYLMEQWLQNFSYRIEISIWMILAGGFLTFILAFGTSGYQLLKAATANPINSLRND